ncbi:YDG/SRA domain-containing protein [Actinoplanes sp. CA-015351]|uniref:YDG/SRA domain-containing protein n=1 Tax=Actinoplanes sp. CA-015351 TaxID=3239897 RepID=UPI003D954821
MDFDEIAVALEQIREGRPRGPKSLHQSATLLWAAQRAAAGEPRVAAWHDVRSQLTELVAAMGEQGGSETVATGILRLGDSSIIDLVFETPHEFGTAAQTGLLFDQQNPFMGLTDDAYETLAEQGNFDKFAEIALDGLPKPKARLVREYFGLFAGFGEVPGVPEGTVFENRAALADRKVHLNHQAGIVGSGERGAESVVVSGGYEDDEDYDDLIIYTGHGGRDHATGKQIKDQSFEGSGNAALVTSHVNQAPVRVIRGLDAKSGGGYRYDGLFYVESFWQERGKSGFNVCRYRLVKVSEVAQSAATIVDKVVLPQGNITPGRRVATVGQIARVRALSRAIKVLHDFTCQLCGVRLAVAGRGYAQGAHIRPVGRPHDGTDTADNLLCLCPNCHILFDNGEVLVGDDFRIISTYPNLGSLSLVDGHEISSENLAYHRNMFPQQ